MPKVAPLGLDDITIRPDVERYGVPRDCLNVLSTSYRIFYGSISAGEMRYLVCLQGGLLPFHEKYDEAVVKASDQRLVRLHDRLQRAYEILLHRNAPPRHFYRLYRGAEISITGSTDLPEDYQDFLRGVQEEMGARKSQSI